MSEEPHLHVEEWFRIKGRGFVAVIKERWPDTEYDPNNYTNKTVIINDEKFRCAGAETFAIPRSKDHPYKHSFGLLVKEIETEKPHKPEKNKEKDLPPDSRIESDYGRPMDIAPASSVKPSKPKKSETIETEDWIATFTDD